MIFDFLSSPAGLGAVVGLVGGSFGYILARFYIRPLLRYRIVKNRVAAALAGKRLPKNRDNNALTPAAVYGECASALTECYNEQLPRWYQLALANRGESPLEAARHLMTLASTRHPDHAAKRVEKIKKVLLLA